MYLCTWRNCGQTFADLSAFIKHQKKSHSASKNFKYTCGGCKNKFDTYDACKMHSIRAHGDLRQTQPAPGSRSANYNCVSCPSSYSCVQTLCHHVLKDHLEDTANSVLCPLNNVCKSRSLFKKQSLYTHLSNYHAGWAQRVRLPQMDVIEEQVRDPEENDSHTSDNDHNLFQGQVQDYGRDESCSSQDSEITFDEAEHKQKLILADKMAQFYLKIESDCLVPASTVQTICEGIYDLVVQNLTIMKRRIITEIKDYVPEAEERDKIVNNIITSDTFFMVHQKKYGNGPWLCTDALRKSYYKKHYFFVEPEEIKLSGDTSDPQCIYYVSPQKSLEVMLDDASIQAHVDKSFSRPARDDLNVIEDYRDGSVYQSRPSSEQKTIDLILFQDAFKPTNDISSAANKHNTLGGYMTIGNLGPAVRSQLDALQLVFLIPKYKLIFKKGSLRKKAFDRLVKDLKHLERNGYLYKGEIIKVILQFIVGDNLGQHEIGGFIGSFSAEYFCRFCPTTRTLFHSEPWTSLPFRTREDYDHCMATADELKSINQDVVHYKGVKTSEFKSKFNELQNFHVCDPSLAPCIAHDVLSGLLEEDMAAIIHHFVARKWFTYKDMESLIDRLKYHPSDLANKPSYPRDSSFKLGGHAVQNWTIMRLLPFLLGKDRIADTHDEFWKLYLSLKEMCEYIFAPSLTLEQISYLKVVAENYMDQRMQLNLPLKPKAHYVIHQADLWIAMGPLIHLWTLNFESLHSYFRRVAKTAHNFINPGLTMAKGHCLYLAYMSTGVCFKTGTSNPSEERNLDLQDIPQGIEIPTFPINAQRVKSVTVDGVLYKEGEWILLGNLNEVEIHIGKTTLIICDQNHVTLLLETYRSDIMSNYGIYKIHPGRLSYVFVTTDKLKYPKSQPIYTFHHDLCFSIKNVLSMETPFQ